MLKGYLTTDEAAAKLGVSGARVRQIIKAGLLKGVEKIGQINMIPEKEVERVKAMDRKAGRPKKSPK